MIVDRVHVDRANLRLTLAVKPPGSVFLVSDAMSLAGSDAGEFVLQGQRIRRLEGRLVGADGRGARREAGHERAAVVFALDERVDRVSVRADGGRHDLAVLVARGARLGDDDGAAGHGGGERRAGVRHA